MAGRFPFDSQGHGNNNNPLQNAQVRAALGLSQVDEALYLQQRQQELQRDFQIRQMLLQEQIDQQNRLDSMLHEQQLKAIGEHLQEFPDLQQHYHSLLLNEQLQRHEEQTLLRERAQIQQQEEIRRRQYGLLQKEVQQRAAVQQVQRDQGTGGATAAATAAAAGAAASASAAARLRDIAADSLAGNAVKRSELEKRTFAKPDEDTDMGGKRRARSDTQDSADMMDRKPKASRGRGKRATSATRKFVGTEDGSTAMDVEDDGDDDDEEEEAEDSPMKPSALDLLDFATSAPEPSTSPAIGRQPVFTAATAAAASISTAAAGAFGGFATASRFTMDDLVAAASSEKKLDDAVDTLVGIKKEVEWPDSEQEYDSAREYQMAVKKGETISYDGFVSVLPQLPEEPEYVPGEAEEVGEEEKGKRKSLLEVDSEASKREGKAKPVQKQASKTPSKESDPKAADVALVEYPYPIDTWWPSVNLIKRERKAAGEPQNEDDFPDTHGSSEPGSQFRANLPKIREKLSTEVEPGVLEKIPHCKVHRMLMKKRKNPSAPELVYCWQVTELYPNDIMVCCSICGTWRHAACGGHYKPFSVRESINTPFTAVCDRCHEEEAILRDFPHGRRRIDRQRSEQIRRGLATSAAMRQASFSKHGGTYKWPLGSVSATHIGGHTRSVHSRHDKAEKQWTDMATRLARGYGYRPKERVKVRTKELERLLVSVEDAEGHTDRHNMMLFLLQDTARDHPVGFESRRRNIFDPEEDDASSGEGGSDPPSLEKEMLSADGPTCVLAPPSVEEEEQTDRAPTTCSRAGCTKKPRFDSLFCSDACGVSALESDLLRTFQYASDIHPSMLRN